MVLVSLIYIILAKNISVKIIEAKNIELFFTGKINNRNINEKLDIRKTKIGFNINGKEFKTIEMVGKIKYKNRIYDATFKVFTNTHSVLIIENIDLEKYLKGVVPMEVPYTWHTEVLKAQAVIARTFALKNINKHINEGFNVCSDVCCQVYRGIKDYENVEKAVRETKGLVVIYKGELAHTYYHSNCGGRTEDVANVWGGRFDYLKGVECFKNHNSHDDLWTANYTINELSNIFAATIIDIFSSKVSPTGRTIEYGIKTKEGVIYVKGNEMRLKLNPFKLRSNMLKKIEKKGDIISFTGTGWGHGVGLCQDGARKHAELGNDFRKIIKYYYPGVELMKIND